MRMPVHQDEIAITEIASDDRHGQRDASMSCYDRDRAGDLARFVW